MAATQKRPLQVSLVGLYSAVCRCCAVTGQVTLLLLLLFVPFGPFYMNSFKSWSALMKQRRLFTSNKTQVYLIYHADLYIKFYVWLSVCVRVLLHACMHACVWVCVVPHLVAWSSWMNSQLLQKEFPNKISLVTIPLSLICHFNKSIKMICLWSLWWHRDVVKENLMLLCTYKQKLIEITKL